MSLLVIRRFWGGANCGVSWVTITVINCGRYTTVRVPGGADLVTYWFEKARKQIENKHIRRVGLLSTQTIRRGGSRKILERIKDTGDIFMAWSDRPWILDGASVRVSLIGFDDGSEAQKSLDNILVSSINVDLSAAIDLTKVKPLAENQGIAFIGDTKKGSFDISHEIATSMLSDLGNPNGRPNSDVVVPWMNAYDVMQRARGMWIVDFGTAMPESEAAQYEKPFEYVRMHVRPERNLTGGILSNDETGGYMVVRHPRCVTPSTD